MGITEILVESAGGVLMKTMKDAAVVVGILHIQRLKSRSTNQGVLCSQSKLSHIPVPSMSFLTYYSQIYC
jgi:hypothetical protein